MPSRLGNGHSVTFFSAMMPEARFNDLSDTVYLNASDYRVGDRIGDFRVTAE